MTIKRDSIGRDQIGAERLTAGFRKHRYCYDAFYDGPIAWDGEAAAADGVPGGTTGRTNRIFTGQHTFEYYILGAAQTIVAPTLATDGGYDWGLDQTVAEGVEINFGSLKTGHPRVYRVGTDEFYARLRLSVEDVSGVDLFFGIRGGVTIQAVQTALATYTDFAGIRILGDSSSAAGQLSLLHNINDATDATETVLTSTLADGVAVELEVRVKGRRVRFYIDGVEVGTFLNQEMDSGDYFTPVAYILHTTDVAGQIKTFQFECGLLEDRPEALLSA